MQWPQHMGRWGGSVGRNAGFIHLGGGHPAAHFAIVRQGFSSTAGPVHAQEICLLPVARSMGPLVQLFATSCLHYLHLLNLSPRTLNHCILEALEMFALGWQETLRILQTGWSVASVGFSNSSKHIILLRQNRCLFRQFQSSEEGSK